MPDRAVDLNNPFSLILLNMSEKGLFKDAVRDGMSLSTYFFQLVSDIPRAGPVCMKDSSGSSIEYNLVSLPFYLLEQLHRLIKSAEK